MTECISQHEHMCCNRVSIVIAMLLPLQPSARQKNFTVLSESQTLLIDALFIKISVAVAEIQLREPVFEITHVFPNFLHLLTFSSGTLITLQTHCVCLQDGAKASHMKLYWDFKAKWLTSGGKLVNFNKRYQNTKKISVYIGIIAILGNFNDLLVSRNLILLYFITITSV